MANEFIARNGLISLKDSTITGSLIVTGPITGSISSASYAATASYALNSSGGGGGTISFPFSGSAVISGSLEIKNSALPIPSGSVFAPTNNFTTLYASSSVSQSQDGYITLNTVGINKASSLNGVLDVNGNTIVTGSLIVTGGITGSLLGTASLASTASFVNPLRQNIIISGSLNITGSVTITGSVAGNAIALTIASNTASLDLNSGNFFTLQLVSGSNTFINPSNITPGQTANILVSTTGSATVSFPSTVLQISGSPYIPTTTTGKDIVTMVSLNTSSLYLAYVKTLI